MKFFPRGNLRDSIQDGSRLRVLAWGESHVTGTESVTRNGKALGSGSANDGARQCGLKQRTALRTVFDMTKLFEWRPSQGAYPSAFTRGFPPPFIFEREICAHRRVFQRARAHCSTLRIVIVCFSLVCACACAWPFFSVCALTRTRHVVGNTKLNNLI